MLVLLAIPLPAQAAPARLAQPAQAGSGNHLKLLDVVMLVDESGSETPLKVAQEKQAAGTIAQTLLNPASRVAVVGFGGRNGVVPNQNPIDVVCRPTIASPADQQYLSTCVNGLHRRTEAEGDDTDYVAALSQALSYFNPATSYGKQSPPGAAKVILFMTDGGLDVHRDPQYLPDWQVKAKAAVAQQLALAHQFGVQVWPLGFGSIDQQDQNYLNYMAASGAKTSCGARSVQPRAAVVQNPANALAAMRKLYAAVGCYGLTTTPKVPVGSGRTLHLTIPPIASAAAISVDKGAAGVTVSYTMPDGAAVTGAPLDGSTFERSGQQTPVDVLRITNPQPGSWAIKLSAPPKLAGELVSAAVFWQGAVRDVITASPPSAQPGEPVRVTLTVLSQHGLITDPGTLRNLHVTASVSGDGVGLTGIPVSNASGQGPPSATYTGTFRAPRQLGTLTFGGTAAGYGLYATVMPAQVQVTRLAAPLTNTMQFDLPASVRVGQSVPGQITFNNQTGRAVPLRLLLHVVHAHAAITNPGGTFLVPKGSSTQPFTVTFAKNSPTGPAYLRLQLLAAANPRVVYGDGVYPDFAVTTPPTWLEKYLWALIALVVVLLLGLGYAEQRHLVYHRRKDVRGLTATLSRDGSAAGPALRASGVKWADTFPFVIRNETAPTVRLGHVDKTRDDPVYLARRVMVKRSWDGRVTVTPPDGQDFTVTAGGPGESLPNGLNLAFRDSKSRRARGPDRTPPPPDSANGSRGRPDKPNPLL